MRVWPGQPYPLGATWDGEGVNFALFSENATHVELCLFDRPRGAEEIARIPVRERTHRVWHCYLPDLRPGALYGYRVYGPHAPELGHRFNPHKLLIDPYAKALASGVEWNDALFGFVAQRPQDDLSFDARDSAPHAPKSIVIDSAFTWGDDRPPRVPWTQTVLYECHVKGTTYRHPLVPEKQRGTYLGLASDAFLDHLTKLGVTAVELMPVHQCIVERHLLDRGLTNYWGYHTIGFFAPDTRFSVGWRGEQVYEFKSMVKRFHSAGIEVILDVVYNHTGEGSHLGPTLSFRGIDNSTYYRLDPDRPRYYLDFTGCGNSLNMLHPRTIQLIMDSLRYWVREMHVDGFRFDLAPALARELHEVDRLGRFFAMVQQDPLLSQVKLIAEPWDLGVGGYQVGNFPAGWSEWNGRYRDTMRRFWRGDPGQVAELATRIAGSSDLYSPRRRHTFGSINFICCHDGFTLHDLVSYEHKHNEANGENGQDGHNENLSRNWGVEGPTDDAAVNDLRERAKRNLLATLAFSQGVPMITAGDEMGRTQRGNNNAYCHDSDVNWVNWNLSDAQHDLLDFARRVFAVRKANGVLRRRAFFRGAPIEGADAKDLTWFRPDGREMSGEDWSDGNRRTLGMLIHGQATDDVDERGQLVTGNTLYLFLNADEAAVEVMLPTLEEPGLWREVMNTARPGRRFVDPLQFSVSGHTLVLLEYVETNGQGERSDGQRSARRPRW